MSTRTRWSTSLANQRFERPRVTSACAASSVTSAVAPTRYDWPAATAVRPRTAPITTAAAKSIAVHCDSVRRCATRSPSTAVPYISAALPTTPISSSVCPPSHAGMPPPVLVGAGHLPRWAAGSAPRARGRRHDGRPGDLRPLGGGVDEPPGVDHDRGPVGPHRGDDLLGRLGDDVLGTVAEVHHRVRVRLDAFDLGRIQAAALPGRAREADHLQVLLAPRCRGGTGVHRQVRGGARAGRRPVSPRRGVRPVIRAARVLLDPVSDGVPVVPVGSWRVPTAHRLGACPISPRALAPCSTCTPHRRSWCWPTSGTSSPPAWSPTSTASGPWPRPATRSQRHSATRTARTSRSTCTWTWSAGSPRPWTCR